MVQESGVQSPGRVIQKTQKTVLDATLLNTQHYKVKKIKDKVEQSREWSSAVSLHFDVVAIEKGPFGSPLTKVANFTYSNTEIWFIRKSLITIN